MQAGASGLGAGALALRLCLVSHSSLQLCLLPLGLFSASEPLAGSPLALAMALWSHLTPGVGLRPAPGRMRGSVSEGSGWAVEMDSCCSNTLLGLALAVQEAQELGGSILGFSVITRPLRALRCFKEELSHAPNTKPHSPRTPRCVSASLQKPQLGLIKAEGQSSIPC